MAPDQYLDGTTAKRNDFVVGKDNAGNFAFGAVQQIRPATTRKETVAVFEDVEEEQSDGTKVKVNRHTRNDEKLVTDPVFCLVGNSPILCRVNDLLLAETALKLATSRLETSNEPEPPVEQAS